MTRKTTPAETAPAERIPSEESLLLLLARASHRLEVALAERSTELGIVPDQWRLLSILAAGGGHTMTELSQLGVLPAASTTRGVDRIVSLGLAYRRVDPLDRRRVVVFLSAQGRRAVEPIRQIELATEREIGAALGPRGYVSLVDALSRVTAAPE